MKRNPSSRSRTGIGMQKVRPLSMFIPSPKLLNAGASSSRNRSQPSRSASTLCNNPARSGSTITCRLSWNRKNRSHWNSPDRVRLCLQLRGESLSTKRHTPNLGPFRPISRILPTLQPKRQRVHMAVPSRDAHEQPAAIAELISSLDH